ncbi:unnamed protein product [Bursaphelenchus okinawaensis]|uniref:Large ribosomal subunit protein bL21m n=1 Tax=Bursaphelenchus okinawaensis TaxID=465554 RepID=A0A811KI03_9BILA|nr:unnamed protein product [Bursaphelenchus okinawaensis]CAG9103594.1 unnamed protein product [Bursaphelenchus okinawaensis]
MSSKVFQSLFRNVTGSQRLFTRCQSRDLSQKEASSHSAAKVEHFSRGDFVTSKVVEAVSNNRNRLFAVVFINGRQYKVSDGDVIVVEKSVPLDLGERINFEKVLLVGGAEFTLLGRPTLDPQMVSVGATVVEKTNAQPHIKYTRKDGKQIMNILWRSHELTTLRINNITVDPAHIQTV